MPRAFLRNLASLVGLAVVTTAAEGAAESATTAARASTVVMIAPFVFLAVFLILAFYWVRSGREYTPSQQEVDDKYIEKLRIVYGFLLVVAALFVTLAVLVVTLAAVDTPSNIVAIIASVTGVIGTLTAAFFGIQQAGAGRSQALNTLAAEIRSERSSGDDIDKRVRPKARHGDVETGVDYRESETTPSDDPGQQGYQNNPFSGWNGDSPATSNGAFEVLRRRLLPILGDIFQVLVTGVLHSSFIFFFVFAIKFFGLNSTNVCIKLTEMTDNIFNLIFFSAWIIISSVIACISYLNILRSHVFYIRVIIAILCMFLSLCLGVFAVFNTCGT